MFRYVVRRLIGVGVMMIIISFITFMLFFAIPNNPAALSCGKGCTPTVIKQTEHKMGIDEPILVQYGKYMKGIVAGRTFGEGTAVNDCPAPCLGFSFRSDRPVTGLIVDALPVTLSISFGAFVLWVFFGISTGVVSALKRGTIIDRATMIVTLATVSLPVFFTGLMMLYFIVIKFGLMPYPSYVGLLDNPLQWAQNLLLPWLSLAFLQAALYTRLTRANMLETMGEDYIRTARAKGLAERKVIFKHGLRAALTPIVTIAGIDLGTLLGGAVITESVYNFNGLGRLLIRSVTGLDLPTIVGVTVLAAFFIILLNFLVDLLYAAIDPRVRLV